MAHNRTKRKWTVRRVLIGIVLLYVGYAGLLFTFQRCVVFPEWKRAEPDVNPQVFGYELLTVAERAANDQNAGDQIEAWFLPSGRAEPSPVVVFGHGNAEFVSDWFEPLTPYVNLGVGVLLVEYPGYGGAEGDPSEESIEDALVAAYDVIAERPDVDPTRIVAHGRSIGGGAVCQLIENRPIRAAIFESTFASLSGLSPRVLLPSFLVRDEFDNVSVIRDFDGPVLVMHGTEDTLVPIESGRELAEVAQDVRFVERPCGHNDCVLDEAGYWSVITAFLADSGIISTEPAGH